MFLYNKNHNHILIYRITCITVYDDQLIDKSIKFLLGKWYYLHYDFHKH